MVVEKQDERNGLDCPTEKVEQLRNRSLLGLLCHCKSPETLSLKLKTHLPSLLLADRCRPSSSVIARGGMEQIWVRVK